MKLFKRVKKEEDGSLTIEASISMVCFTLVMVFLLTLINTCRAQALVQNSVDKTALEMSQFMYLYSATGLYYETVDVSGAGAEAWNTATGMINATEEGVKNTADLIQNGADSKIVNEIQNADNSNRGKHLGEGVNLLYGYIKSDDKSNYNVDGSTIATTVIGAVDGDGSISSHYNAIYSGVNSIKDDPIGFVSALAKYGLGQANSYLFGAALGRAVTVGYIGTNNKGIDSEKFADSKLKSLGVKEGVNGLDFKRSCVFSSQVGDPRDINIVCTYDVTVFGMLGDFKVTLANSASARAWLDGDCTVELAKVYEARNKSIRDNAKNDG